VGEQTEHGGHRTHQPETQNQHIQLLGTLTGRRDLAIDVIDKLVLAEAVGLVYDRLAADRASG